VAAAPEWITVRRRAARVLNILPPAQSAQKIASDSFISWFVAFMQIIIIFLTPILHPAYSLRS
jgi:hypothetical protein